MSFVFMSEHYRYFFHCKCNFNIDHCAFKKKNEKNNLKNQICRCSCGHCMQMPLAKECVCCKETKVLLELMKNDEVECITDHPGFEPVCLNTYNLDTAYNQYKQQYNRQIQNIPE